jgi:hypothetical protein
VKPKFALQRRKIALQRIILAVSIGLFQIALDSSTIRWLTGNQPKRFGNPSTGLCPGNRAGIFRSGERQDGTEVLSGETATGRKS